MTSEAKIGLLLGLVFIFIIAFIINGLPSFWHKSNSNELTAATENAEDNSAGIAANERKAGETIEKIEPAAANISQTAETQASSDTRFTAELPKNGTKVLAGAELQPVTTAQALPPENTEQNPSVQQTPVQQAKQTYVVCPGDSLYTIAKKFYGAAEAGKKSTIDLLFNANKGVLKSPDSIQVGQKLAIPQAADKSSKKSKAENVVAAAKTQHAKTAQNSESKQTVVTADDKTKSSREYIVKAGDNLWKIAAKQLGNGNRYDEIEELNSDALKDSENVTVGMHLKMPAR